MVLIIQILVDILFCALWDVWIKKKLLKLHNLYIHVCHLILQPFLIYNKPIMAKSICDLLYVQQTFEHQMNMLHDE